MRLRLALFSLIFMPVGAHAQDVEIPAPSRIDYQRPSVSLPSGRSQTESDAPVVRNGSATSTATASVNLGDRPVYHSRAYSGSAAIGNSEDPSRVADGAWRFRAEMHFGWDQVQTELFDNDRTEDGFVYGLGMGADRKFGNWFAGGFASIDWSPTKSEWDYSSGGGGIATRELITDRIAQDIEIGLRVGIHIDDQVNLYTSTAYSLIVRDLMASVSTIDSSDVTHEILSEGDITQDGWRVGAGSEIRLFGDIYGKAEYRYSSYGEDADVPGTEIARHQVVTGVGLRF